MSKYHEKPDVSAQPIHQSSDSKGNRYTIDFGERRRVKEACKQYGIKNKKKHKLRQKRKAMENTAEYYGDRCDQDILNQASKVVRETLFKNYKETENETN